MATIVENEIKTEKKKLQFASSAFRGLIIPILFLILWQTLSSLDIISVKLFSSPLLIAEKFIELIITGALWQHLEISLLRATAGFILGGSLGIIFGVITGMSQKSEQYLNPTIQMLRTIPLLAITPLFILWFGFGELSKILLIALGSFFPLYLQTFLGIRNVDNKLYDVAKIYEYSKSQIIRKLLIPGSLPNILLGIRLSLSTAWVCLVVAELLGASKGVGFMIQDARSFLQTEIVFVGIIIFAIVGKLSDSFVRVLENRLLKWQDSFKA